MGTCDFLEAAFALDGDDATFYRSAAPPGAGDHFTVAFDPPKLVHGIEVLTGVNNRGLLDGGEGQVSTDGKEFKTVRKLDKGAAKAVLKENRVRAVRLRSPSRQAEPLVLRSINLRLLVEVAGEVRNLGLAAGAGNVATTRGDARLTHLTGT